MKPQKTSSPSNAHLLSRTLKVFFARTSLLALGVAFELTGKYVSDLQEETAHWEDGRRIGIGVLPHGPFITLLKQGKRIFFLGQDLQNPHLSILFKNLDSALMVFTGQIGSPRAAAENRVCVHGNNGHAVQITRAMAVVQTYLFPNYILKKTFKRSPKLRITQLITKAKIMGLLVPKMLMGALK